MNAPSASIQTQSSINILFGQSVVKQNSPISIDLKFGVFSKTNENIRFNLQNMLNIPIQNETLIVELNAKSGYGSDLADKIMTFLKSSKTYISMNSQQKVQIKATGKGNTCYVFINSHQFSEPFQKISSVCSDLKSQIDNNQNNEILLSIKSFNGCQEIRKLLDNQGAMRAAFDSLSVRFQFNKTKIVEKILQKIFEELQLNPLIGPLKTFNNLNLSVNFASSTEFDRYQKLRKFALVQRKLQTFFFKAIKGQFSDQIKISYFNEVFSFNGKIHGEQIQTLLDALFGQPQNE